MFRILDFQKLGLQTLIKQTVNLYMLSTSRADHMYKMCRISSTSPKCKYTFEKRDKEKKIPRAIIWWCFSLPASLWFIIQPPYANIAFLHIKEKTYFVDFWGAEDFCRSSGRRSCSSTGGSVIVMCQENSVLNDLPSSTCSRMMGRFQISTLPWNINYVKAEAGSGARWVR